MPLGYIVSIVLFPDSFMQVSFYAKLVNNVGFGSVFLTENMVDDEKDKTSSLKRYYTFNPNFKLRISITLLLQKILKDFYLNKCFFLWIWTIFHLYVFILRIFTCVLSYFQSTYPSGPYFLPYWGTLQPLLNLTRKHENKRNMMFFQQQNFRLTIKTFLF